MTVEWFQKLKEYDSLTKERIKHLKAAEGQDTRLAALNVRRQDEEIHLNELKQETLNAQHELYETEKRLKIAEEQLQRLKDVGGDEKKILDLVNDVSANEEAAFALLARLDSLAEEKRDKETFLKGLAKTMAEIAAESGIERGDHMDEVAKLDHRLTSLFAEIPLEFQQLLTKTLAKKLAVGPFTRVENGSCFFCRFKISRLEESEIDMQKLLKTCPQCSRIFLPYGA